MSINNQSAQQRRLQKRQPAGARGGANSNISQYSNGQTAGSGVVNVEMGSIDYNGVQQQNRGRGDDQDRRGSQDRRASQSHYQQQAQQQQPGKQTQMYDQDAEPYYQDPNQRGYSKQRSMKQRPGPANAPITIGGGPTDQFSMGSIQNDSSAMGAGGHDSFAGDVSGGGFDGGYSAQAAQKMSIRFGGENLDPEQRKMSNMVRTTKYTILTWAPLSLFWQFKRAANVYFLVITILTTMPFSPKRPASMIGTFALVLIFTMLKEAYEDYQRYKSDSELNNRDSQRLNYQTQSFEVCQWKDIRVGDIVKVEKDQEIPADLLLVSAPKDIVFVSTMNLDGETNLKDRELVTSTVKDNKILRFSGKVDADLPNPNLDVWEGRLQSKQLGKAKPCSPKNLLLRGCTLKNTPYCFGICLYVGNQSKIMMNQKKPPAKISNLMRLMNKLLYSVFAFQFLIICLYATLSLFWMRDNKDIHIYLDIQGELSFQRWIVQFFTYQVAYSHMIPISLYVIIEMLKLIQAKIINNDVKMFFADPEDMNFALCRNSDLIEELGQVEFVFSDKTGTLTQNKMEFKKCQVCQETFGNLTDADIHEGISEYQGMIQSSVKVAQDAMMKALNPGQQQRGVPTNADGQKLYDFFRLLAVCHTVVVDKDPRSGEVTYQASSPDELALIQGSKQAGIELKERSQQFIIVTNQLTKQDEEYEILREFPFDSDRKRMTLIVKHRGRYLLMCKGADSIMLPRVNKDAKNQQSLPRVKRELLSFAKEGLRTLVVCQKELDPNDYNKLDKQIYQIQTSDMPLVQKDQALADLYDSQERNLNYIGSSAIEDKLQYGVPETIDMLIKANIKVWVLTGDKQETAIEIGKSCKLIQQDMRLEILSRPNAQELERELDRLRHQFKNIDSPDFLDIELFRSQNMIEGQRLSIVIDGPTLAFVLASENLSMKFFRLGLLASSVVCCRVSPKQKADVVGLAKVHKKWITLSIGDGANDVPMIMEAHIGVGVRGKEGTQAVRSADYALSQFFYLHRLLLVHGRWGYRRVSWVVCYYFYKNIVLVFTEIFFSLENGFSGQIFFADWLQTLYNALWSSWACLFAYSLEQDVNDQYVYWYPQVYKAGQKGVYFNFKVFWKWIIFSMWHGAVCYFGTVQGLRGPVDSTGMTQSHWYTSCLAFTLIMHIITGKLFIETVYWNWLAGIMNIACLLFYYGSVIGGNTSAIAEIFQPEINGQYFEMLSSGKAWIVLLVLPMVALLPDTAYMLCQKIFFPTPTDAVMLRQQRQPDYFFDGFSEVFQPDLPGDPANMIELLQKRHPHHLRVTKQGSGDPRGGAPDQQNQPLNVYDESRYETGNAMVTNNMAPRAGGGQGQRFQSHQVNGLQDYSD